MEFKNKKCDDVFHASLFFFTAFLISAIVLLFFAPVAATWLALLAVVPIFNMLGAGIVERKLNGPPFFWRKPEPVEETREEEQEREEELEEEQEREEDREDEIEEQIDNELTEEKEPKIEEVHEMGALVTPVEEKKEEVKINPIKEFFNPIQRSKQQKK